MSALTPFTFTLENDEGEEVEHSLPAKWAVCGRCHGDGTHVNPNIDGNGITASEMEELCDRDPDFPEDYMSGMYDVPCEECHGNHVVKEVDEEHLSEEQKALYQQWCKAQQAAHEYDYEDAYFRRMESGY